MSAWTDFLRKIEKTLSSLEEEGCYTPLFRGQADSSWVLLPSLARYNWRMEGMEPKFNPEEDLYFDFVTQAGTLLPENSSSWSNIFVMQHYGLPTRLLDWTETFSVALYFAVRDADEEAVIWILDPFELNRSTISRPQTIHPTDLGHEYKAYFIDRTAKLEGDIVAISPLRHNPRVFHQRAGFTIHDNIETPLESLHPEFVTKVVLKEEGFSDAFRFLELAGVNEFSLFPDLDGLARKLKWEYFDY